MFLNFWFFVVQVITKLHKACLAYNAWKAENKPDYKPWLFPEQSTLPLLDKADIYAMNNNGTAEEIVDEEGVNEDDFSEDSEKGLPS